MSKLVNKHRLLLSLRVCWNCGVFVNFGWLCWDCIRAMLISAATVVGAFLVAKLLNGKVP